MNIIVGIIRRGSIVFESNDSDQAPITSIILKHTGMSFIRLIAMKEAISALKNNYAAAPNQFDSIVAVSAINHHHFKFSIVKR